MSLLHHPALGDTNRDGKLDAVVSQSREIEQASMAFSPARVMQMEQENQLFFSRK